MSTAYQIRDWDKHFENNKSRERDHCSFVCVPNKQHGLGFCRVMAEPDGAMIYGIWHLLTGCCSQQIKPRHGWLTDTGRAPDGQQAGTPLAPQDLALKFRRPVSEVVRALYVLSSASVGWVVCFCDGKEVPAECPSGAHVVPAECPSGALEGREGREGREEKGENGVEALSRTEFVETPSWEEWWNYCQRITFVSEWYAKDKFLAAEQENWKNKPNWRKYAERCRGWWEQDGRPMTPAGNGNQRYISDEKRKKIEHERLYGPSEVPGWYEKKIADDLAEIERQNIALKAMKARKAKDQ
jgi:hypothetical protein